MEKQAPERCPACGSGNLVRDISMSQSVEVGTTGLEYKKGMLLRNTEPLLADLCQQCGTVVRLHVKSTDRKWITRP